MSRRSILFELGLTLCVVMIAGAARAAIHDGGAAEGLMFHPPRVGRSMLAISGHVAIAQHTVPEPTTMLLLGTGMIGLAAVIRRWIKRQR